MSVSNTSFLTFDFIPNHNSKWVVIFSLFSSDDIARILKQTSSVDNLIFFWLLYLLCSRSIEHFFLQTFIISIYIYIYRLIAQASRVFSNGPRDLGSIPGRVLPKTLKMVLDTSLLNTQQYNVRIEGKVDQSRERSNARWSSYWKGSLQVALDYVRQLYLFTVDFGVQVDLAYKSIWNFLTRNSVRTIPAL